MIPGKIKGCMTEIRCLEPSLKNADLDNLLDVLNPEIPRVDTPPDPETPAAEEHKEPLKKRRRFRFRFDFYFSIGFE